MIIDFPFRNIKKKHLIQVFIGVNCQIFCNAEHNEKIRNIFTNESNTNIKP